jgi:phosphonate transport system substrate-binding protein
MQRRLIFPGWGLLLSLLLAVGCTAVQGAVAGDDRAQTLVIGHVSENPTKTYKKLKPMVSYAAERMADLGIVAGEALVAKDNQQMIAYLRQGKVDWVTDTPFSAVVYEENAGAQLLLKKWKKGVPDYHTVFFCRKESEIQSMRDLTGKTIAFEDPGSTSAYMVPAALLLREGLSLALLSSPREEPPVDMVGYAFSRQEINTSTWVYRGLVEAGALSNLDWHNDDHSFKIHKERFRIFHRSSPFPRAIELVRGDLHDRIKQRLREILLEADADPEAVAVLKAYQKTKKFEALDADDRARLAEIRDLMGVVASHLE